MTYENILVTCDFGRIWGLPNTSKTPPNTKSKVDLRIRASVHHETIIKLPISSSIEFVYISPRVLSYFLNIFVIVIIKLLLFIIMVLSMIIYTIVYVILAIMRE